MANRQIDIAINGAFLRKSSKNGGVQGEANVTGIHLVLDESWLGFGKRLVWRDAAGENPVEVVLFDGAGVDPLVYDTAIPMEALGLAGWCSFTLEGYADEDGIPKVAKTMGDYLQVRQSESLYAPTQPTPEQAQQILAALGKTELVVAQGVTLAKSWAAGGTGTREQEETDNAKYYARQGVDSAAAASQSAQQGAAFAQGAGVSAGQAHTSALAAGEQSARADASAQQAQQAQGAAVAAQQGAHAAQAAAAQSAQSAQNAHLGAVDEKQHAQGAAQLAKEDRLAANVAKLEAMDWAGEAKQAELQAVAAREVTVELRDGVLVMAQATHSSAQQAQAQADQAKGEAERAKAEADRAAQIVGGDFATKLEVGEAKDQAIATAAVDATQKANQAQANAVAASRPVGWVPEWTQVEGKPGVFPPTTHRDSHKSGGLDPLMAQDIGAEPVGSAATAKEQAIATAAVDATQKANQAQANAVAASRPVGWMPTWGEVGAAPTTHGHSKSQISDFPSTMPPAAHSHDAGGITSGVLAVSRGGTGMSAMDGTDYTTIRFRAAGLRSADTNPSLNGTINWTYG